MESRKEPLNQGWKRITELRLEKNLNQVWRRITKSGSEKHDRVEVGEEKPD